MKKLITICSVVAMILATSGVANAHWDSNMPYKMHYPQLPDPYGWDVSFSNGIALADDWQCSESGPVNDIHFWVSFKGGFVPPENFVGPTFNVVIFADIPAQDEIPSHPGDLLWEQTFEDGQYEGDYAGTGSQGWFDPATGDAIPNDHTDYFQVNIDSIVNPFIQEKGIIYWLGIQMLSQPTDYEIGWKTSISSHFMDDAVWMTATGGGELIYPEIDPRYPDSIDLAFVITPEPATICLLTIGSLAFIGKKK